jgi:hypothetical protein
MISLIGRDSYAAPSFFAFIDRSLCDASAKEIGATPRQPAGVIGSFDLASMLAQQRTEAVDRVDNAVRR